MQPIRSGLVAALCLSCGVVPCCAQEARAGREATRLVRMPSLFEVVGVDVEARTVQVRQGRSYERRTGVGVYGKPVEVDVPSRTKESLPLANGAHLRKIEGPLSAGLLRLGDRISVSGPVKWFALSSPTAQGQAAYANEFTVISASPLMLRAGEAAAEPAGQEVARLPFTSGAYGQPVGHISIARPRGDVGNLSSAFRVTLSVTRPEALQFVRTTFLALEEIAAALKAGAEVEVETRSAANGGREVRSLTIYEGSLRPPLIEMRPPRFGTEPARKPLAPNPLLEQLRR